MSESMAVRIASAFPPGVYAADCPTRELLDHLTARWAPLVLVSLSDSESLRWSELRRRLQNVSEKMLAQTLRTLERDGFVLRDARPVVPPHVEYSLTDRGRDLLTVLLPLLTWVADHAEEVLDRD